jgi:Uma2 family endonuclease
MSKSLLDEPDPIPDGPDYAELALASLEGLELVTDDGEPMESTWHRKCMTLLIEQVEYHFRDRDDFYVGGNAFIYYSPAQARNRDFRGPDFFYVSNTTRQPPRPCWVVWNENLRRPDVVIELTSPTTREEDYGAKFRTYRDTLEVKNYFIYDPDARLLEGWRLDRRRYVPIRPDENGRLPSDELGLLLGTWEGEYLRDTMTWLRLFDPSGRPVPIPAEAARQEKEAEKQRADAEKQRADTAEAELARLKEQLARFQPGSEGPS